MYDLVWEDGWDLVCVQVDVWKRRAGRGTFPLLEAGRDLLLLLFIVIVCMYYYYCGVSFEAGRNRAYYCEPRQVRQACYCIVWPTTPNMNPVTDRQATTFCIIIKPNFPNLMGNRQAMGTGGSVCSQILNLIIVPGIVLFIDPGV